MDCLGQRDICGMFSIVASVLVAVVGVSVGVDVVSMVVGNAGTTSVFNDTASNAFRRAGPLKGGRVVSGRKSVTRAGVGDSVGTWSCGRNASGEWKVGEEEDW